MSHFVQNQRWAPIATKIGFCLLLIVFLTFESYANEPVSTKASFDNGLTVVVTEMPANPMVAVYGLVKTGSATEGDFLGAGISHFLEHMLFKGTKKRKVGEIAAEIQAVGGSINASTGLDFTMYTINVPYDQFDKGLDVLSDMLMSSALDPREVEKEREVIFNEMRLHNDNPDRKLSENTFKTVYHLHPYRHPVIGYKELFAGISRDDLYKYYKHYYAPNNMIISIAGNVKSDEVIAKVKKAFEGFPRQIERARNLPDEPPQMHERYIEETYPTDVTRMSLAYSGIKLLHPDLYALDVLAEILGQGQSSRLYQKLFEDMKIVHGVGASNYTPIDRGMFEIEASLEEVNRAQVTEEILKEVERVKKEPVSVEELEKARRQVLSDYVFGLQSSEQIAWHQAMDEAFAGDPDFSKRYVESVRAVTAEDIQCVANQYLQHDHLTISVLKPQGQQEASSTKSSTVDVGEIQKVVLDNGLRVLLRKNNFLPTVSIRLVLNGGVRFETEDNNGINELMVRTWVRGTKDRTSAQIAELVDVRGMSLGSYAGNNSVSVSLDFLKEDWNVALDLLSEIVQSPTFPDEEVAKLKEWLKARIRQRQDSIGEYTGLAVNKILYTGHPYRLDSLGTSESVDRLDREKIMSFYQRLAVPSNMVLAVFGDIDPDAVLKDLQTRFSGLPKGSVATPEPPLAPLETAQTKTQNLDKEQTMVMVAFQGVGVENKDYYGLELMGDILGSTFNGRMFNNIREKLGQAYTLGGGAMPGIGVGKIQFYVITDEKSLDKATELVYKEIVDLKKKPVPAKELAEMKTYLKGAQKASLETNGEFAFQVALDELYGLGFERYKSYEQKIDEVTSKDIQRLANQYLDLKRSVTVKTRPAVKEEKASQPLKKGS